MFGLSDDRKLGLAAIGSGLSQLAVGQAPNIMASPAAQMLQQRQQLTAMQESGVLDRFSPEQQAILAQMPPAVAQKVIAGEVFRQPTTPKVTDDMTEYQFARSQGFNGSFLDWQVGQRAAGATVINNNMGSTGIDYGDPPPGMSWRRDATGQVLIDPTTGIPQAGYIVGSKEERAAREATVEGAQSAIAASAAEEEKAALEGRAGNVVLEDISRVKEKIENSSFYSPATGALATILKNVGGTRAADVEALSMTIRGNIGFDRLQQMRDASPTGGALGQVSQQELATLQSVLGSLEQSQSEEQLLYNLERLEGIYTNIMRKASAYPNAAEFGFQAPGEENLPNFVEMSNEELDEWIKANGG